MKTPQQLSVTTVTDRNAQEKFYVMDTHGNSLPLRHNYILKPQDSAAFVHPCMFALRCPDTVNSGYSAPLYIISSISIVTVCSHGLCVLCS